MEQQRVFVHDHEKYEGRTLEDALRCVISLRVFQKRIWIQQVH